MGRHGTAQATRALAVLVLAVTLAQGCRPAGEPSTDVERTTRRLPEGYGVRLDRTNRDPADFGVTELPEGVHIRTGPSGILFRAQDRIDGGPYAVSAVFTQVAAPTGHREGYGLFVGGADLEGSAQRYAYFLVRGDGRYLIRVRWGEHVRDVSEGWVPSDAVELAADGDATNALSIQVEGDRVRFHCNGIQVAEVDAEQLPAYGVTGIRVNHNLDVVVEDIQILR